MSSKSELIQKDPLLQELEKDNAFEEFCKVIESYQPPPFAHLHDSKAVAEQDVDALRKALRVDLMPNDEQDIFDDLTTGDLSGDSRERTIFEHFARQVTEDGVDQMSPEELKGLALRWAVLGIATRVHLARYIEANKLFGSNRRIGDICPKYWWEVGTNISTMFKIANGKKVIDGRFVFYRELTSPGSRVYLSGR